MSTTDWLRHQVARLEDEIRRHSVFDTESPASATELRELRTKVVIHRYLKQQLLRRETVVVRDPMFDTQEFVLVHKG
jgi:hypothetical protein